MKPGAVPRKDLKGIQKWTTPSGIRTIRLHYSSRPDRDPSTPRGQEWLAQSTKGLVGGVTNPIWRKEQEIDFSIREGLPIYKGFKDDRHVSKAPILPVKGIPILRGWDFGGTPACAITQLTGLPRWNILPSLFVPNDQFMGIIRFARVVLEYCNVHYPEYEFLEIADPSGTARKDTDERTCYDILRGNKHIKPEHGGGFGLNVQPGEVAWQKRFERMEQVIGRNEDDGIAFLQVDPRERFIIDAFNGGYQRRKIATTNLFADDPEKNEYSHVMNGLEYIASRVFTFTVSSTKPKQPEPELAESYVL